MAKKSLAQKIQESASTNEVAPKKHLSKYALKKLAQQNSWYEEPETNKIESSDKRAPAVHESDNTASTQDKSSIISTKTPASNNSSGKKSSTRLSLRNNKKFSLNNNNNNNKQNKSGNKDSLKNQESRQSQAKAKAIKAALEGASGIEKVESNQNKKTHSFSRKGKIITVVRNDNKQSAHKQAKAIEHRAKLEKHFKAVREAREEALAKLEAQGKTYQKPNRDSEALPDKINFERKVVQTCGVLVKDRIPNLTDLAERQAAMMPHNRRDQMLFAPIKRETQPIKGTDFMVKFLDLWSRRNDPLGVFDSFFEHVKSVRKNENGIAYIGLPAFLKFLSGASKNKIIDDYAFEFRQFIKRREITDFISSMQKPALEWAKQRPPLEPNYAFVYFDTYPIHIKLGKKRVINVHTLFILGITLDGRKDILGIVPDLNSSRVSVSFWDDILGHLKKLGCHEICFAIAAFKCRYLERSIKTFFPKATMHFNLLELLQFDSFSLPENMRGQFMEDAQLLADALNYDEAYKLLLQMRNKWEHHMKEGETVLQGSLDYLKVHTLLPPGDRILFTTQKIVSQAASLLMGNKAPDDFFSDNAEMLTYLFYRYILIAKQYWIEHQDYVVNNLSFAKLFTQLRHEDIGGAKLLNHLLYEQHQEFMYRHFGQFGNGPVFNLNPNKKRISLSGQIDDNAALRGDTLNDKSNAALNTAPDDTILNCQTDSQIYHEENNNTSLLDKGVSDLKSNKVVLKDHKQANNKSVIEDISASALTLNESHKLGGSLLLSLSAPNSIFDGERKLEDINFDKSNIFSVEHMHSYEHSAFRALGGIDLDHSVPAFLHESSATLTLNNSHSTSFVENNDVLGYHQELNSNELDNSQNQEIKTGLKSKPSKLAMALRFDYPKFKQRHVEINGQNYLLTHAALGDLDQEKLNSQVLQFNSDITGIDKLDGTFGFKIIRSKHIDHKFLIKSSQGVDKVKDNHHMVKKPDLLIPSRSNAHEATLEASYSRHFKANNKSSLYRVGNNMSSLQYQYYVDSIAGLDDLDKVNLINDLNANEQKKPNSYLESVSSNIQRANAVIGMLRPSIAQALRKDRVELKKKDRNVISLCLGSDFSFDDINNVIHQVTPIFRSAMQNKIAMKAEKEKEKKAKERQRLKEKAHARYLKRQALKACANMEQEHVNEIGADNKVSNHNDLTDKDFEPLNASDFNPLNTVDESLALKESGSLLSAPITISSEDNDNKLSFPQGLILSGNDNTQGSELGELTSLDGLLKLSDNEESKLTLIKPSEAKVQVVASEYRNSVASNMAINSPLGVTTQKPDNSIKLKTSQL